MNYEQANQLILILTDIKDELHQINTNLESFFDNEDYEDKVLDDKLEKIREELENIHGGMP